MMFSDEQLSYAAKELCLAFAYSFHDSEECSHEFSPAFNRRMNRLIKRSKHPDFYSAMRRVAGILLAIIIGSSIWLTLDEEVRAEFFGWVGEKIENAQHYFFEGEEASEVPNVRYRLGELPTGYREESTFETENSVDITYVNDAGQYLSLGYIFRPTENSITETAFLDMDKMEREMVQVNGSPAECFVDPEGKVGNVIVWQDSRKNTLLYLSGYFDQSLLIRMAEGVLREE